MRTVAVLALLFVAACSQTPVVQQASETTCSIAYASFKQEIDAAVSARQDGDNVGALYHTNGAQMNLDILLDRGCCRFSASCPAFVSL